ncbi:diadenylate cyclase CdaA [Plebeiibacterium marinum]|uniref:Diadenylate cyclase n=1 Tax=Plebeiibacterium marinum TaxID=2992111 RepID=A0AAE3MDH5_9BACT|nr:diadenylate cyclase CdaA [Plebeiobacterium marinum]MCW3805938.1 diadenylate cyclase CdaA [Plebeiobacterium marinum]
MTFLDIRFIDIVDIVVVAYLMHRLYKLIRGTVAQNIFFGLFAFVVLWLLIRSLNMELSATILDNIVNVGVIALIVVFQQEIRRFFLLLGTRYNLANRFSFEKIFSTPSTGVMNFYNKPIVRACQNLSKTKTGAIIVISRKSEMLDYVQTGELVNGVISSRLLENIFFKNSPLHDGAVIVAQNKIKAAGCILPVSQSFDLPKKLGLRHRAALGVTESTDASAIVVSEETGRISFFHAGEINHGVSPEELEQLLEKEIK